MYKETIEIWLEWFRFIICRRVTRTTSIVTFILWVLTLDKLSPACKLFLNTPDVVIHKLDVLSKQIPLWLCKAETFRCKTFLTINDFGFPNVYSHHFTLVKNIYWHNFVLSKLIDILINAILANLHDSNTWTANLKGLRLIDSNLIHRCLSLYTLTLNLSVGLGILSTLKGLIKQRFQHCFIVNTFLFFNFVS
jgi:hypothetical protein